MFETIGVDPGFGNFKLARTGLNGGTKIAVVPSVVGVGQLDLGLLSAGNLGRRQRQVKPDQVTFDGVSYLAGANVARFARPVQRMDFLRLSDGPELRALFYAALARLLGPGEHQASIMVGLPVEVLADRQRARSTLRGLRSWMVGQHQFSVNDAELALDVGQVQAMAQPAGACHPRKGARPRAPRHGHEPQQPGRSLLL